MTVKSTINAVYDDYWKDKKKKENYLQNQEPKYKINISLHSEVLHLLCFKAIFNKRSYFYSN